MSFTYQYSQPDEYHFSLDSTVATQIIADELKKSKSNFSQFQILDLCAGCGVMGFELSYHIPEIRNIDFLDVQEIYKEHFEKNKKIVNRPELNVHFLHMNYEKLKQEQFEKKYDVIICNPPYFQAEHGKLSPSEFKNRCRFFIDSTFTQLIESILFVIRTNGKAFILIRPLTDHKQSLLSELISMLPKNYTAQKIADVRGTDLVLLAEK